MRLKKKQKLNEIGGEEELFDIMKSVPTAANIENYARIVKEKAVLRKLIDVGTSIVELAYDGYDEVEAIMDRAENMIFKIAQDKEKKEVYSVKDLIDEEFERLEKVYQNKEK